MSKSYSGSDISWFEVLDQGDVIRLFKPTQSSPLSFTWSGFKKCPIEYAKAFHVALGEAIAEGEQSAAQVPSSASTTDEDQKDMKTDD